MTKRRPDTVKHKWKGTKTRTINLVAYLANRLRDRKLRRNEQLHNHHRREQRKDDECEAVESANGRLLVHDRLTKRDLRGGAANK